jgi:hypothetical protein
MAPSDHQGAIGRINAESLTAGGNINIVNEVTVHQFKEARKKTWRDLASFIYPSVDLATDIRRSYSAQLVGHLHRTFRATGYTRFSSLVHIQETQVDAQRAFRVILQSQHAGYVGNIQTLLKQLWDENNPERVALQEAFRAEVQELASKWQLDLELSAEYSLTAYDFVYDPQCLRISIKPDKTLSTSPVDYPKLVQCTSELFCLLAAFSRSRIAEVDMNSVHKSYSLSKLFLDILDFGAVDYNKIRVNVDDPEEWDYVSPRADKEAAKYA